MKTPLLAALGAASLLASTTPVTALDNNVPPGGLPSATIYSATVLPERKGVVSWKTLAGVEQVMQGKASTPRFSPDILALDRQSIRIQGFVLALDVGERQKHFLVTAVPPHCSFCLPAGPDAIVEVFAKTPVRYGLEPVVLAGKLAVLRDDPSGLLYQMTEAEPVEADGR